VRTIRLLRLVLVLATAVGLAITPKLWVSSHRLFPLTPVWGGLPQPPFPFDYILAGLLLASLAGVELAPQAGLFIKIFLALAGLLAALDQGRWQPWVLQYAVMFGALLILPWNRPSQWTARETGGALDACRLFMAWTYFYSGLQKLGYGFVIVLAGMLEPVFQRLHLNTAWLTLRLLVPAALLLGLVECASGVMLVFERTRPVAVVSTILMHVSLLLWLGPLGLNWNYAIWPWNLAMIALLLLLFRRGSPWDFKTLARRHPYAQAVGVVFGVLPLLTLLGWADSDLGFSLYSGAIKAGNIYVPPQRVPELPELVRHYTKPDGLIEIDKWCEAELGAPLYPETRVFVAVGRQVASWLGPGATVRVIEVERPNRLTGQRKATTFDPLKY
jgi:uncharacterized membrane protein YphA (DoxX/SURF4 family)